MVATTDENNRLEDSTGIRATIYYPADEDTNGEPGLLKTNQVQQLDLAPGDVLLLQGQLSQPSGKRNPGGFDYRLYLKSQSIDGLLTVTGKHRTNWSGAINLLPDISDQKTLEHQSDVNFSKDVSDLLKGVVFGEKNINEDLARRFQDAGVTHVLSVSGLHVGYVFWHCLCC